MRKIPSEYENPIDDILLDLCESNINIMKSIGATPNIITIIRIIISFFTLYYFYFSCNTFYVILGFSLFYYLDCLDGHYARGTNQVTILGDYLDHFADMFNDIVFIIILITKNFTYKNEIIVLFFIILYLQLVHLGLQQKVYYKSNNKEDDELLSLLNHIHPFDEKHITWTKYFGCGTFNLFKLILVYWIQTHCN